MTKLDAIDVEIVRLLQADGRLPNTEIGRRLGVAEGTIRKRIERLLRERVMQIGAWTDPLKIGYQTYTSIQIEVNPPDIEKVAERLATLPEIFFLGICTGAFDIYAAALFRSNEHMYEFLTKRLNRVAGIVHTSTSSMIRIVKRQYAYPVPDTHASTDGIGKSSLPIPARAKRAREKRVKRFLDHK